MDSAGMLAELSKQFAEGLPKYTLDARLQGLASWVIASLGPEVVRTLPVFWQKSVATTIMGCRMLRVGIYLAKSRNAFVDEFGCGRSMAGKRSRFYALDKTLPTSLISRMPTTHCGPGRLRRFKRWKVNG